MFSSIPDTTGPRVHALFSNRIVRRNGPPVLPGGMAQSGKTAVSFSLPADGIDLRPELWPIALGDASSSSAVTLASLAFPMDP